MRLVTKCCKCGKPLTDRELEDSETEGVEYECEACANEPLPEIDETTVQ